VFTAACILPITLQQITQRQTHIHMVYIVFTAACILPITLQ